MSTTFALTSASALETPVIVIDTCIVGGDFDDFSSSFSSPFTPSLSSPSPFFSSPSSLSPESSSFSTFLNIPPFTTNSPSTRNLRVHRGNVVPASPVTPFTPVNSPASPAVRDAYLGVPDFGVVSPCVRWKSWSPSLNSCAGGGAGIGRGELMMSPVAPPNTPCSPLALAGRDNRGFRDGEGEDGEVLIRSESVSEESVNNFWNTSGCLTRERTLGNIPQIVVGFEEEGWGQLGADADADAGIGEGCIVESWEIEIQLWS